MHTYTRETVAEVLGASDIVDVVGAAIELKPAGTGRFKALCPFHTEKTPSFTVSRDRQMFKCFGCDKGGDAISFLRDFEGLTFIEALEKLADRGGVVLPAKVQQNQGDDYRRKKLYELGKLASQLYTRLLHDPQQGKPAREYLEQRQISEDITERFATGFAPDTWSTLLDEIREKSFDNATIDASGLTRRGDRGSSYDFFRNRIMFPIRDLSGNVVAFGGRDLGDSPAKYINSPETIIYKKSRILYGLYEARDAMRKEKKAIVVEGYFDLMRCFEAGVENVVATCGTALTRDQANLLRRYVPEVIVLFDGDPAGLRAAFRGISVLVATGLTVRAMVLPDNNDPDDFIREKGIEAFRERVENAPDAIAFHVQANNERIKSIEGRTEVAKEIFEIIHEIPDAMRQDEYLKYTAQQLHINEWACRTEYQKTIRNRQQRERFRPQTAPKPSLNQDDCQFIRVLLEDDIHLRETLQAIKDITISEGPLKEILEALREGGGPDTYHCLESEQARTLYAAAATFDSIESDRARTLVTKRLTSFKKKALQAEASRIRSQIEDAMRTKNSSRVSELLHHKIGIERQIEEVGAP